MREAGFTFIELLVATAITLLIAMAAVSFMTVHVAVARAQPEAADVQQRARGAASVMAADLASAGASADADGVAGNLACCLPAVQPRRIGLRSADPPGTARDDVITIVRAVSGASPAALRAPLSGGLLALERSAGCQASPLCGLAEDDDVVLFDAEGRHDFLVVGAVAGFVDEAPVVPRQSGAPYVFPAGSTAVAVETRTYYFDAEARQVRQYDGRLSDVPVIDDAVAMRFEYWGEAGVPPRTRRAVGEASCWFGADGLPRHGAVVAPAGSPLVRLPLESLRDGPWCGSGENRFDADLLRIRRVRVVVRVAAGSDDARGTGDAFLRAGSATSAMRLVPDVEVTVDVSPRNLNAD
jgi:prepilin-type N-terminal cleavage/methylation domain-containing protein